MNKQDIFDIVVSHLIQQGKQSLAIDPYGMNTICSYRGVDGAMCAVGCLIPDEFYVKEMEGNGCQYGKVRTVLERLGINDFDFLSDLQDMHDNNEDGYSIEDIEQIAEKHGVVYIHLIRGI